MTLRQFLSVLGARWRLFLIWLLGTVVFVVGGSFLLPKKYTAVATVVVDVKPDLIAPYAMQSALSPTIVATQSEIIASDRVARRVVRSLKLTESPQIRQQFQDENNGEGDIETWLINSLWLSLDVKPGRESNVINVLFKGQDPRFAAGMANAFVQAYLDTAIELRVDPAKQYSSFFDARAKEAREDLERAQTRLSEYQRENGVVMADERMDIETQRLNELNSQLVLIQSLAAEAGSRQAQAAAGSADKLAEVTNNPVIAALRADLSRSEVRLQELGAKLGDANPQVVELKASIAELRQRIDTEVKRLGAGVGVSNSISRQREAQVRADLDAQRTRVLKLKQVRDEGALIARDVENAQRTYDQILQRQSQSAIESRATASNASLLSPAMPPIEASFPRITLNAILSVFLGILLGVVAVVVKELRDRRIRNVEDVVIGLGLPVLADFSSIGRQRKAWLGLGAKKAPALGYSSK